MVGLKRVYTPKLKDNPWKWQSEETKKKLMSRPPPPLDIKTVREFRRVELERMLNELMFLTKQQLADKIKDPDLSVVETMLCSIAAKAITGADQQRLDFLLNRLIGKVQDKVSHEHQHNFVLPSPQEAREILDADPCLSIPSKSVEDI